MGGFFHPSLFMRNRQMKLPSLFLEQMSSLLPEPELKDFLASYESERLYGLRTNRAKITARQFAEAAPFPVTQIPWIDNGFFYRPDVRPARDPYYFAGLYYLQEPSAMTPANRLPVRPGEKVLDLCAAPGGKSTELAAKLAGTGTLVCNDISPSRLKALLKNLELFGVENACVLSETPQRLSTRFEGYFDKILIDAPCSGEGMFRKEPAVMKSWTEHGNDFYVRLQEEITEAAIRMLAPGGMLLYSTCTFCPKENEQIVSRMLRLDGSLSLVSPAPYEGFSSGHPEWADGRKELEKCVRIWPHRMDGEGHFLALLKKNADADTIVDGQTADADLSDTAAPADNSRGTKLQLSLLPEDAGEFFSQVRRGYDFTRLEERQDRLFIRPGCEKEVSGLRVMRSGLFLGECKKGRFEPSQALAMTLGADDFANSLNLRHQDPRVLKYLKGETIEDEYVGNGWVLVCLDGFALGFGKASGGMIKNKLLAGWRYM